MTYQEFNSIRDTKLTVRETEVLTLTAIGKTRGEIATILTISEETVKVYHERICRKFNAVNKTQAATLAITLGIIEPYKGLIPFTQSVIE